MQSFYPSIEKAARPELRDKPVVVAGDPNIRSGVVLAACPIAKKWGVETAEALWQAEEKCSQLVVIRPRMQTYIDTSVKITHILGTFSDKVEPYSVDEQFIDMTHTLHLFSDDPYTAARLLQRSIRHQTGVYSRVGIGPNKVLAKMACDHFAKKNAAGIFHLHHRNLQEKLWPLPVGKMFGVGKRMSSHLQKMGVRSIGQLARYSLSTLKKRWGINGEVLWLTANGHDLAPVSPEMHYGQKAVGHHMTLPRDYKELDHIKVIILELSEEVGRRARTRGYIGQTVSVGAGGANRAVPTGFHRQVKIPFATDYGMDIFDHAFKLFCRHWDGHPVRSIGVTLSGLQSSTDHQLSLFDPFMEKERLSRAMDMIKDRYGADAILRASSKTIAGQAAERAKKIGGHYK